MVELEVKQHFFEGILLRSHVLVSKITEICRLVLVIVGLTDLLHESSIFDKEAFLTELHSRSLTTAREEEEFTTYFAT